MNLEEVEITSPLKKAKSAKARSYQHTEFSSFHHTSHLYGKSFCIFAKNNRFRLFLYKVISHAYFEHFIVLTIIASCVLLLMKDPFRDPASSFNQGLIVTDYIILVIYFLELLMKLIVYGFIMNGPESFMRKFWNVLDLALLIMTAVGTLDESLDFAKTNVKPFRVLRFIKIIYLVPASRQSMKILILSIPELISVFFYFFLNILFFGLIAMKYFRLSFYYCTSLDEEMLKQVIDKWNCFDFGGDWINQDTNYDSIFQAISTLFQFCTTENWMKIMLLKLFLKV